MTDSTPTLQAELAEARDQGRRQGLAIAALALSLVAFVSMLGAEKAIMALVLAAGALSGPASPQVRRRAQAAIGLALLYLVTVAVVLVVYQDELGQLFQLLLKLG